MTRPNTTASQRAELAYSSLHTWVFVGLAAFMIMIGAIAAGPERLAQNFTDMTMGIFGGDTPDNNGAMSANG